MESILLLFMYSISSDHLILHMLALSWDYGNVWAGPLGTRSSVYAQASYFYRKRCPQANVWCGFGTSREVELYLLNVQALYLQSWVLWVLYYGWRQRPSSWQKGWFLSRNLPTMNSSPRNPVEMLDPGTLDIQCDSMKTSIWMESQGNLLHLRTMSC